MHPIALDRPPEERAEPLLAEGRLARSLRLRERILRVERFVTMEQVAAAIQLFVPARVTTLTMAPDASPCSAVNWLAMTTYSRTASIERPPRGLARMLLSLLTPSMRYELLRDQLTAGVDAAASDASDARRGLCERGKRAPRHRKGIELVAADGRAQRVAGRLDERRLRRSRSRFQRASRP